MNGKSNEGDHVEYEHACSKDGGVATEERRAVEQLKIVVSMSVRVVKAVVVFS